MAHNQQMPVHSAVHQMPTELVEAVLADLQPTDIIPARQVCAAWRHIVDGLPKLLRLTYKTSTVAPESEDPHMAELTAVSNNVTIPKKRFQGQPL